MVVETATQTVKSGLAQMLKGGVIMDVVTPEHARIAAEAGACSVMALERVPADIRKTGGVARMSDPSLIRGIIDTVSIPVMAKVRIGHFVEASILEALGVDYIDESEVLTPADESYHIDKRGFAVPFVCGCRDLGEALRRIAEGAAMIRTKGEAGTGNIVEAVRHMRAVQGRFVRCRRWAMRSWCPYARDIGAPVELVRETRELGRLPVVNFAAGGGGDAGGCGADDAFGRGRGVRGQRDFQVAGAGADGGGDRAGGDALRRRQCVGGGIDQPAAGDAGPGDGGDSPA